MTLSFDEEEMQARGAQRYHVRQEAILEKGGLAQTADGLFVMEKSLLGCTRRLTSIITGEADRARGRPNQVLTKLQGIAPEVACFLSLSTVITVLGSRENPDYCQVVSRIGKTVERELIWKSVEERDTELFREVKQLHSRFNEEYASALSLKRLTEVKLSVDHWDNKTRSLVGALLFDILHEEGLVQKKTVKVRKEYVCLVSFTEQVIQWLEQRRAKGETGGLPGMSPVYAPVIQRPLDWSNNWDGGYHSIRLPLVKKGSRKPVSPEVYAAVNRMQAVGLRINARVYALVKQLWTEGRSVGKLPLAKRKELLPNLTTEEWSQLAPAAQAERRSRNRDIHRHNERAVSDLASISQTLDMAGDLLDREFWLPYQLDYRGRVYAVPLLNGQGPDWMKGMIEFAEGKPLGDRGSQWLALSLAGLYDGEYRGKRLSKSSFQARMDWVSENEALFRRIASDPYATVEEWSCADKPFQFLRTVLDWVSYLDVGDSYVSFCVVSLDGSCSGIQHYSALLRDQVGAESVNLLPTEEPRDVYQDVALAVGYSVAEDDDSEHRRFWLARGVDRKVVKKPVMTYGYSSRIPGFTDWYQHNFTKDRDTARYLAKHTLTAIEERLHAVAAGMSWLIKCAELVAKEGKALEWKTPCGFPVVQKIETVPSIKVITTIKGKRLQVSIPGKPRGINVPKMKNSIGPNFVHSMDASHLIKTVNLIVQDHGVDQFLLVHDSFGTLAADADAMFEAVRVAFVEMYSNHDPLRDFHQAVYDTLSPEGREKLPEPPERGDLDVEQVLHSLYCFA